MFGEEQEIRKDAEHNLALEEDGMAGFFERGGVADEHVQDNRTIHFHQLSTIIVLELYTPRRRM